MEIRAWKYQDIARIAEAEKECFPKEPWSFQMLASGFETEAFSGVVADDCGEIAGYGSITMTDEEADVQNIAVLEQYRRSGIGTAILQSLLEIAKKRGVKRVFLEVRVSNGVAMGMYLKCGFVGVYARTRYYSDGEDCLVMVKNLA